jgi:hypothetical protein
MIIDCTAAPSWRMRDIASLPSDRMGDDPPCFSCALARSAFQRLTVRNVCTRAIAWRTTGSWLRPTLRASAPRSISVAEPLVPSASSSLLVRGPRARSPITERS